MNSRFCQGPGDFCWDPAPVGPTLVTESYPPTGSWTKEGRRAPYVPEGVWHALPFDQCKPFLLCPSVTNFKAILQSTSYLTTCHIICYLYSLVTVHLTSELFFIYLLTPVFEIFTSYCNTHYCILQNIFTHISTFSDFPFSSYETPYDPVTLTFQWPINCTAPYTGNERQINKIWPLQLTSPEMKAILYRATSDQRLWL